MLAGVSFALVAVSPATAIGPAATLVDLDCDLAAGCLFDGNANDVNAPTVEAAYNDFHIEPPLPATISLTFLAMTGDSFDGKDDLSGSWTLPGFTVDYLAVKAGDQFMLYSLGGVDGDIGGSWSTAGLVNITGGRDPKEVQLGLSHLTFYGSSIPSAVPEPASWGMMIAGFGLVGSAMRRRSMKTVLA